MVKKTFFFVNKKKAAHKQLERITLWDLYLFDTFETSDKSDKSEKPP